MKNYNKIYRFSIGVIFLVMLLPFISRAQMKRVENLRNYYTTPVHFGFTLGVNSTGFIIRTAKDFQLFDTLKAVLPLAQPGFNLGIVSELALGEYVTFRFIPSLAFAQRSLAYYFVGPSSYILTKKVESTFLDFPLDLKFRSKRINNFAAYLLGGAKYSYDLASQKDNLDPMNQIVKLKKADWAYEVGAGLDFFLPYFKLGLELKLSVGTRDLMVRSNNIFSNSVDKLNSQVLLFSVTFEG